MNTKGYNPVSVREIAKRRPQRDDRVPAFPFQVRHADGGHAPGAVCGMIEDVFTTHVRWELEHDLRHFMRRYMDIAEQRIASGGFISAPSADRRAQHGAGQRRHLVP